MRPETATTGDCRKSRVTPNRTPTWQRIGEVADAGGPTALDVMTESTRASDAVARVLTTDVMCVACIMGKTGLDLDPVLGAIAALEANVRLVRTWGRCRVCSRKKNQFLLTMAEAASSP